MEDFARLTGLEPLGAAPNRYLWTDAFAVCNYLGLCQRTGEVRYRELALQLVDQVHHILGRHRPDDPRTGWISGLGEAEGEEHPTAGGLRIGKRLPERRRDEPGSERLEWDQDGQYYHYLTKWMHALHRVYHATGDLRYLRWAMELAKVAHARFTYTPLRGGRRRMHWKMSIDLSRPLVASMGQHDPLDGFVTYCELQAGSGGGQPGLPDLTAEIAGMAGILEEVELFTDDPLGTGGLLSDASRIARLIAGEESNGGETSPGRGNVPGGGSGAGMAPPEGGAVVFSDLLGNVLDAALGGVEAFADSGCQGLPADYRLAFRELGLSIGLSGVEGLLHLMHDNPGLFGGDSSLQVRAEALVGYVPIGKAVTGFWMDERNQASGPWQEHREINMVMLATGLVPDGFLGI